MEPQFVLPAQYAIEGGIEPLTLVRVCVRACGIDLPRALYMHVCDLPLGYTLGLNLFWGTSLQQYEADSRHSHLPCFHLHLNMLKLTSQENISVVVFPSISY